MKSNLLIKSDVSVKSAMKQMDSNGEKILFVINDKQRLLGSLSDGDIRRWILSEGALDEKIDKIYNKNPLSVESNHKVEDVKQLMLNTKIEWIPVIDSNKKITDVLLWENIFGKGAMAPKDKLDVPVVIMAGGTGNRLDPFTKILPKALIPIGEKPVIEIILEKFIPYGIKEFYVSINHKSKMIKAYFEEINAPYRIKYIQEEKPLGTAGSLKLLEGKITDSFFVSNCDILIDSDYSQIYNFHKENKHDITIVSSYKRYIIPYGICDVENGGILKDLREKPESNLLVNTGMYILKPGVLKFIPDNKFYQMTELINEVKDNGGVVGVYPIGEKAWIDIGQWEEYKEAIKRLSIE